MSGMKLETVNLADLKPLERNVRRHVERQIEAFCKSLEQFGQTRAFVIDEENNILVGNGMYVAMKKAGWENASAYRLSNLTEKQKKKLVLSDNRVFSLGIDEYTIMNDMLKEIAMDGDFDIAGYEPDSLKLLVGDVHEITDTALSYGIVPEAEKKVLQPVQPPIEEHQEQVSSNTVVQGQEKAAPPSTMTVTRTIVCPNCGEVISI